MKPQSLDHHVRYHPVFHFFGAPLALITIIGSIVNLCIAIKNNDQIWLALFILVTSFLLVVSFFLTRIYSNKVQDRVIRMEENFRHFTLTGKPLNPQLTIGQIIALRFSSNEEFVALSEKAVNERLSSKEIKQTIKNWRADEYRV
ncbi:hypothetical protein COJ46_10075 [Bacillus sp. AFS077874]|uniref:DUF6526 family protein n=1 Tax=unclassified Bacillus (in: firmicutes) TaxID=185979 RepID=UPI000BEE6954|nr:MULTISPECIES: DUF6526 family protein [unclassified Bacillus (in: firmicutes)]PEC51089.1 hypothetical protein CON00_03375 [Bacillus sp. AFS096315]PFM81256.1 hypothetical protein COJ46_10075 [Bacillus sp. AFS077874]